MRLLANTILAGFFPFLVTLYLSPLVLLVETLVARRFLNPGFSLGGIFLRVTAANIFSFLIGSFFADETIRGLQYASFETIPVIVTVWAFFMSCASEYLVMRYFLPAITVRRCAKAVLGMNIASYAFVVPVLWLFIFGRPT